MIESRGGESIKGTVIADEELIDLGRRAVEALGCRGPCTVQAFRDEEIGLGITDVNTRFGGACPAHLYAALPGRTYPGADRAHGAGRADRASHRASSATASPSRATTGSSSSTPTCGPPGATSSVKPARRPRPPRPGRPPRAGRLLANALTVTGTLSAVAITVTQLTAFLAVVRGGSVTAAADELVVTQPSVSSAISALAREVGC